MPSPIPSALADAQFPSSLLELLRVLGAAGHRSWLVGGAVRDLLLHRPRAATDFDVATPARPEEVTRLFRRVIPTGIEHGTVTVLMGKETFEVTTFRGEGAYLDGRRPESVTFLSELEQDLARRDFTMNALAYDPLCGELRDPFGGQEDVRRRLIRAVGDPAARFGEDGLRPMRAVRFAAQLGYTVEPATLAAIPDSLKVTGKVSVERIAEELSRLLVAPAARVGLELLQTSGLLKIALPVLTALPTDRLAHAFHVVDRIDPDPSRRFAAVLHLLPAAAAEQAVLGLRLPVKLAGEVGALLAQPPCLLDRPVELPPDAPALRRWLARVGPDRLAALLALRRADAQALPAPGSAEALDRLSTLEGDAHRELQGQPPLTISDLALEGRAVMEELGVGPGRHVGEALRYLMDRALDDPGCNTREALAKALRAWWAERRTREEP